MDNQPPPLPPPTEQIPARHGCFTAWLILILITNTVTAIASPFLLPMMRQNAPNASPGTVAVMVVAAIANIAFAIALFKWKRWGFYGFIVTSIVALVNNLSIGLGIGQSIFGLIGIAILYAVMNIGGPNKVWLHLK